MAPSAHAKQADRWARSRWRIPACPKEVPLCLTGTVSKICWRFYADALRRRLTRSHSIVGALSMAISQWDSTCLGGGSQFSTLVEGLGGAQKILDVNYYKHSRASLCLVLPPVGSARSAILLLECIEHFIGSPLPQVLRLKKNIPPRGWFLPFPVS
jgi:hypothetical protein